MRIMGNGRNRAIWIAREREWWISLKVLLVHGSGYVESRNPKFLSSRMVIIWGAVFTGFKVN
jgi:hypothetical protein